MDCSFWSTFGVSPHPVPISTYFVFAPWSRWTWGETFGQNLLSSWPPVSSFTIFPLLLLLPSMILTMSLAMAVAYLFSRQTLTWDISCRPVDRLAPAWKLSHSNCYSTQLFLGCCMFKTLLSTSNQNRKGEGSFFCSLIWGLLCLHSPSLRVSHHVAVNHSWEHSYFHSSP